MENTAEDNQVDAILAQRRRGTASEYLIRWQGITTADKNTWDPETNPNYRDKLSEFQQNMERKKSPSRTSTRTRSRSSSRSRTASQTRKSSKSPSRRSRKDASPERKKSPSRKVKAASPKKRSASPGRKASPSRQASPSRRTSPSRKSPARKASPTRKTPERKAKVLEIIERPATVKSVTRHAEEKVVVQRTWSSQGQSEGKTLERRVDVKREVMPKTTRSLCSYFSCSWCAALRPRRCDIPMAIIITCLIVIALSFLIEEWWRQRL